MDEFIEPIPMKANDPRVIANGLPVKADFRIISECKYQKLKTVYDEQQKVKAKTDRFSFLNRLSHIGKKYYVGSRIRWLLQDKKGKGVYCDKCGNIANGIEEGKCLGFRYRIPLCETHLGY